MDKDELSDKFGNETINILVQNYEHNEQGKHHQRLEASNNFGTTNKTLEQALEYQQECAAKGLNRFVLVHDKYKTDCGTFLTDMRAVFAHKLYDYMKDYLGVQKDTLSTSSSEENGSYVFKTLARKTKGLHRIVLHVSREMSQQECTEFYRYLSKTAKEYPNVRFLILDQKERGIEKLEGFEVTRWKE
jgi:hypothetical protein